MTGNTRTRVGDGEGKGRREEGEVVLGKTRELALTAATGPPPSWACDLVATSYNSYNYIITLLKHTSYVLPGSYCWCTR